MTYVHVEQVEDMIKAWQQECADHPALYNQGNVLRDRLERLTADIETPITEVDVRGWGVWAGQAIEGTVARHIAGKVNSLMAARKRAERGEPPPASLPVHDETKGTPPRLAGTWAQT
jgi:hypothetical protein